MNKNQELKFENFISLSEASKQTGYTLDYLGFLCRQGKLKGFKIGRNWFLTKTGLDEFIANYRNGISEITDETGTSIRVHVEQPQPQGQVTVQPLANFAEQDLTKDDFIPAGEDELQEKQAVLAQSFVSGTQMVELNKLKGQVLENLETRIQGISENLRELETKISESSLAGKQEEKTEETTALEAALVAGVLAENSRDHLRHSFNSNFVLGEPQEQLQTISELEPKQPNLFGRDNVKKLFESFSFRPRLDKKIIALATVIATAGFIASVTWTFFNRLTTSDLANETKIVYQGGKNLSNGGAATTTPIYKNVTTVYRNVTQLLGQDQNVLLSLIDARLNQYLAEGKFKGEKGDQGLQGLAGTNGGYFGNVPSGLANNGNGGTISSATYFNADYLTANNVSIPSQLTVSGSSTFSGSATFSGNVNLNGSTTITSLNVTNFNPGFTQGSVVFQGASGLSQDNSNFYYTASTSQLSLGTTTPTLSALMELDSTSKGFLAPRMSSAQRDAITSPAAGLLVFNKDTNQYNFYNGSIWQAVGTGSGGGGGSGGVATGTPGSFAYYAAAEATVSPQTLLYLSQNNIGIGTSTPTSEFTLQATGSPTTLLTIASTSGASLLTVTAGGNLGIGTSTPGSAFTLVGNALLTGNETLLGQLSVGGLFNVTGTSTLATTTISNLALSQPLGLTSGGLGFDSSGVGKGGLIAGTGSATLGIQSVGSDGLCLTASSTSATGLAWSSCSSGSVTGMGANGYVSRWVSASQLGTGILLDSGTVTGVNATSSSYTFNIKGTSGVNPFQVASSNNASLLVIDQNGNVGIGAASPNQNLEVQGNQFVSGKIVAGTGSYISTPFGESPLISAYKSDVAGAPAAGTMISSEVNTQNNYLSFMTNPAYNSGIIFGNDNGNSLGQIIYGNSNNSLQFVTNGSEKVRIDTNGNLGIGTNNPLYKLEVAGTASATELNIVGNINNATLTASSLVVTDANKNLASSNITVNNIISNVSTGTAGNIFNISTSTNSLVINLPTANIVNSGQLSASDWLTFNNKLSGSLTTNQVVYATGASSTASSANFLWLNTAQQLSINSATPTATLVVQGSSTAQSLPIFTVASSSNQTYLTVLANGNVGVGTSSPTAKLSVVDANNDVQAIFGSPGRSTAISFNPDGTNREILRVAAAGAFQVGSAFVTNITLNAGGKTFTFTNGGNLGIGTTTPISSFVVVGTTTKDILNIASSSGTSIMYVASGGNVGIGTTTPNGRLTVTSAGTVNPFTITSSSGTTLLSVDSLGNFNLATLTASSLVVTDANKNLASSNINISNIISNVSTGTSGNIFNISTSTNSLVINLPTANIINSGQLSASDWLTFNNKLSGSLTTNQVVYATGASSTASSANFLWLNTAQQLSINSATPTATLVVQGSSTTQSLDIFRVSSSSNATLFNVTAGGNVGIGTTSPSQKLDVWGNLNVATGSTPTLYVDSGTGNVGVGNATPGAKLDVYTTGNAPATTAMLRVQEGNGNTNNTTGMVQFETDKLSSGYGLYVYGGGSTSGSQLLSSGQLTRIVQAGTYTGSSYTQAGNVLYVDRTYNLNNSGATTTITGAVASFNDTPTASAGALIHTASVVTITQNTTNSTGAVLKVTGNGTGDLLDLANGSGTVVAVTNGGNVGVGMTSPNYKLEVAGTASTTALNVVGNINNATLTASSLVVTDANKNLASSGITVNNIISNVSTGTAGNIFNISTTTNALVINLPTSSINNSGQLSAADWLTFNNKLSGAASAGQVAFYTAATTTGGSGNFTWTSASNTLGITGSTTISNLLTVGGTLGVTGTSTLATTTITNLTVSGSTTISSLNQAGPVK